MNKPQQGEEHGGVGSQCLACFFMLRNKVFNKQITDVGIPFFSLGHLRNIVTKITVGMS